MRLVLLGLLVSCVAPACGGSALIRREDQTFSRSIARYEKTQELVAAEPVDERTEAAMFMTAEGLYRYRFDPPPRSAGSYVAQAAAAAIDLPALQAVASSLDLFELRLKMYDGAVQVWETLLERYPRSRLRPLALYRLGWAYRSVLSPGFPREEPDEAFAELARSHPASPLAAYAREAQAVPWKSQDMATTYSILPGLGQMYAGEYLNGAARMAVALVAAAAIVTPAFIAWQRREELAWGRDWPLLAVGLGGLIVLSIDYTMAYQDALRAVMQYNERMEAEFDRRHPGAP
jgi:hypothetical protein